MRRRDAPVMIILGIDPGLNATGYGAIEARAERVQALAVGTIRPSPKQPLAHRLRELYDALAGVMDRTHPAVTVLEAVYTHHQFLTTAAMMAHARGAICLLGAQRGLPVVEYLPTRIKKALTGHGTASKEQVARAVGARLDCDVTAWPSDATDALALAIAHAHIARTETTLRLPATVHPRRHPQMVMG